MNNLQYVKVKIYRIPYWIQISFLGYMWVFKGYDYRVQQYEFNRLVDCALNNWVPIQQSSVSQCVLGFENSTVSERTSPREQRKSTLLATCGKRTCLVFYFEAISMLINQTLIKLECLHNFSNTIQINAVSWGIKTRWKLDLKQRVA
jgi:hypothetical protein